MTVRAISSWLATLPKRVYFLYLFFQIFCGKHLHIRYNSLLRHRFWEIAAAIIEERLRPYGSKTRCFCPSESKATRIKASLSSPSESNRARSAFLTVFSPCNLRLARVPDCVGRRVCLSGVSYAAAEKSEEGMAWKIWMGAKPFSNIFPSWSTQIGRELTLLSRFLDGSLLLFSFRTTFDSTGDSLTAIFFDHFFDKFFKRKNKGGTPESMPRGG